MMQPGEECWVAERSTCRFLRRTTGDIELPPKSFSDAWSNRVWHDRPKRNLVQLQMLEVRVILTRYPRKIEPITPRSCGAPASPGLRRVDVPLQRIQRTRDWLSRAC
jgi:hypothetical protein